jgi:branched-chain amino acid transport system permease protein
VALFISAVIVGVSLGTIYGLMAFGMVASYRISKVVNLGQAGVAALCASAYWWMTQVWGAPILVGLLAALILGGLLGGLMGFAVLRMNDWPKGLVMIVTLAVTLLLFSVGDRMLPTYNPQTPSPFGDGGFNFLLTFVSYHQVGTLAVCVGLALLMTLVMRRTRFGLFVRAIYDDSDGAATLGIPLNVSVIGVWAAAGVLASVAGCLATNRTTLDTNLLLFISVWGLAGAVLGGMESFALGFIGGLALGMAEGIVGGTFGGQLPPGVENLSALVIMAAGVLYAGTKKRHLSELQT